MSASLEKESGETYAKSDSREDFEAHAPAEGKWLKSPKPDLAELFASGAEIA
jgi:phosphoserine phosphatase